MKVRKSLALLLSLAMVVSMLALPAFAAETPAVGTGTVQGYPDVPGDYWAKDVIDKWAASGLVAGYSNGSFGPSDYITRGQLAMLLDRLMRYQTKAANTYADLTSDAWYADAILGASAAGIIQGSDGAVRPDANITREEVMVMVARVLGLTGEGSGSISFTDEGQISSWASDAVKSMAAKGYVQGNNGAIRPKDTITRAEALTILDNVFTTLYAKADTYTGDVTGNLLVNTSNVTLKDMNVSGDVIIAEGVGDGHIVLDGVTVGGGLVVRGGGENSIVISGESKVGTITMARRDGKVRVAVGDSASVDTVLVGTGSNAVKVEGTVESVSVAASGTELEITGTVKNLTMSESATETSLTIAKGAKVENLSTAAANSSVTVAGTVTTLTASQSAASTTLNVQAGAQVTTLTSAAPQSTISVSGTVTKVETTASATGTSVSTTASAVIKEVVAGAAGTTIEGTGKVESVKANADNVAVNTPGTKVEVAEGASGVTAGGEEIKGGDSTTTDGSTDSGSGGGGGGGGGGGNGGDDAVTTYTVSFDLKDGTYDGKDAIASLSVNSGSKIVLPAAEKMEKSGHTFGGWYKDENYTARWNADTDTVTANVTLYAKWDPKTTPPADTVTVTFKFGNGMEDKVETIDKGTAVSKPAEPSKDGHKFVGWFEDGATAPFNFDTLINESIVLTAKWDPIPENAVTVTYKMNDGRDTTHSTKNVKAGETVGTLPDKPTRIGYTFLSWNMAADGTGDEFTAGTIVNADITVYAQWEPILYTVTFNSDGGSEVAPQEVPMNGIAIEPGKPSKENSIFAGWYNGETLWDFNTKITGDITLTAKWTDVSDPNATYKIAFDLNGGTYKNGAAIPEITNVRYNESLTAQGFVLPTADDVKREGYTFSGWADASGPVDGSSSNLGEGTVTLTAQWKINVYTVTFNGNGGTPVATSTTAEHGAKITAPAEPTREGYKFVAWCKDANGNTAWDFANDTVTAKTELFAKWEIKTFTVTFNSMDGSAVDSITNVTYDTTIKKPADPSKANARFGGWYKDAECTIVWNFDTDTVKSDTTLFAKWNPISENDVIVTFTIDGTTVNTQTVNKGTVVAKPTVNAKEGYELSKWFNGNTEWNFDTVVNENMTLTATWTAITYTVKYDLADGTYDGFVLADNTYALTATYDQELGAITDAKFMDVSKIQKPGYTFAGWTYGEGKEIAKDKLPEAKNLTATQGGIVKLTAKWTPNKYTVKFNVSDGTYNGHQIQDDTYKGSWTVGSKIDFTSGLYFDESQLAPSNTNSGKEFAGWGLAKDATEVIIAVGEIDTFTGTEGNKVIDKLVEALKGIENNSVLNLHAIWKTTSGG